ncbi:MAG: SEC-C domain-containing protein, partial [Actinobacteria bacterium]|nr:SEC-C domain-containing protein [Actinomycetota bacterium]
AIQAEAGAAGTDLSLGRPAPSADSARADAAEPPAWPAVVGGRLGWWPEAEYVRIIRQVPELARVLGDPWRHHTSRVEAALRASSRGGERHIKLADVQFPEFVNYLVSTHADTVDAKVLTNFAPTTFARQTWPPKARAQCWCGSGSRYRDCCGRYR